MSRRNSSTLDALNEAWTPFLGSSFSDEFFHTLSEDCSIGSGSCLLAEGVLGRELDFSLTSAVELGSSELEEGLSDLLLGWLALHLLAC